MSCRQETSEETSDEKGDQSKLHIEEFLKAFPVTMDGDGPTEAARRKAGFGGRKFYDAWRNRQSRMREGGAGCEYNIHFAHLALQPCSLLNVAY